MSKSEEFKALADRADFLHARPDRGVPGEFVRAESAFNSFCWHNSNLIARALRMQDAIENGFSNSQGFDFTSKLGEAAVHAVKDNLVSDAARGLRILAAFREAMK